MTRRPDTPHEQRIVADYHRMAELLAAIDPPAGHAWRADAQQALRWWAGNVTHSTDGIGASLFLRRSDTDHYDPDQLHIEVRVFWHPLGQRHRTEGIRCTLWCEHGPRINFTSRSLIGQQAAFVYAGDVDELWQGIAAVLLPALSIYRERRAGDRLVTERTT